MHPRAERGHVLRIVMQVEATLVQVDGRGHAAAGALHLGEHREGGGRGGAMAARPGHRHHLARERLGHFRLVGEAVKLGLPGADLRRPRPISRAHGLRAGQLEPRGRCVQRPRRKAIRASA